MSNFDYEVIVVGAGHAGIEACLATARLGYSTLLITSNMSRIGYMSCNPSIGGLAKGHMVRELDVLGGQMGLAADSTCIQFKRLNSSRGPAVRGSRVQNDKYLYSKFQQAAIHNQENLKTLEAEVKSLLLENNICLGVVLDDGSKVTSKKVIITTGTFMNGVMHIGLEQTSGGRVGDKASVGLSDQLLNFGFEVKRLKTGTPPRLDKNSIDWSKTIPQYGDEKFYPFSFKSSNEYLLPQVACYLSRTHVQTHDIIRENLDKSPMYCGIIEGVGPRYCPSIEDKVMRFSDRDSHQTFLEPESLTSDLIYLQGISTSLPAEIQDSFIRTIDGLNDVKIVRYGYAVEYDYIEPTQIKHSLETRLVSNLFLAGQINGTSGYEEAAVQGFIAAINAVKSIRNEDPFILSRSEAYIGVLIDDLVTKGTREPYRMFTSRAEHRLVLREDNTIDRLMQRSMELGLHSTAHEEAISSIIAQRNDFSSKLSTERLFPVAVTQEKLLAIGTTVLNKPISFEELLRRPEVTCSSLSTFDFPVPTDPNVSDAVEIQVKYSGYIKKQNELIQQTQRLENLALPEDLDYTLVRGLSTEEVDKLVRVRPRTLGQAQRISGVNPSAIQCLMIHLKGHKKLKELQVGRDE